MEGAQHSLQSVRGIDSRSPGLIRHVAQNRWSAESRWSPTVEIFFASDAAMGYDVAVELVEGLLPSCQVLGVDSPWSPPRNGGALLKSPFRDERIEHAIG